MHLLVCSGTASRYSFKFSRDLIRDKDTSILWSNWPTLKKPTTQKKDSSFKNGFMQKKLTPGIPSHLRGLSLTESFQIQVEWKQHMCFVHAHHQNPSSIKINFKFLTVSLLHCSHKQPCSFQQVPRWAWNKLNMHLKFYYILKVFSGWISSHNLCTWLAGNISRYSSWHTHAVSCWRKWLLFLTCTVSLKLFTRTEAATETCSSKI